jgi:hypothetical protein
MDKLLIPIGFLVLMSVLGFLTQKLKKAAEKRQAEKDRNRNRDRNEDRNPDRREPLRTASSDIDRFLKAIDAQRNKSAPKPRTAQPKPAVVPTVPTARRPRAAETPAPAFPEAKKKNAPAAKVPTATVVDDLPVAKVVGGTSAAPVVTAPAQLVKPQRASVAPPSLTTDTPSEFGALLTRLLSKPNAAALAVALQEVLGPPKCKQGRAG